MREDERPQLLTRRQILASSLAIAGTIPFLTKERATAAPETRTAKLRLTAGTRTLAVNGKPARVFSLIGPNGNPGITLSPGERFHVDLMNQADTPTIIHWHGQLPPWKQDGLRRKGGDAVFGRRILPDAERSRADISLAIPGRTGSSARSQAKTPGAARGYRRSRASKGTATQAGRGETGGNSALSGRFRIGPGALMRQGSGLNVLKRPTDRARTE